ncbi:hypothetical protein HMPREF1624_06723 [Sporothrix schenckii ATCC 58251]|uniref:Glutamyl/glutaminyl-tRNA synthetase class Ib anti-codon binding domain-containing protein n=1 Tax=Sporothrix schenckii (strain ATCC 58251 / de Perez 2211183) TaxID=1391915 RepID=U7PP61_SPOS1|nr:hypothetical protein HMPREF1624_06723 [Sporothrix schenckii ATCC 58251]
MSRLEIAAKSELALVLPSLVLANHLHITGVLPDLIRWFQAGKTLNDDNAGLEPLTLPKYIKKPELGSRTVLLSPTVLLEQVDAQSFAVGEETTLMNGGSAIIQEIENGPGDQTIKTLKLQFTPRGDVKKTEVTWLADTNENLVPVDLVLFDYFITKDKLEKSDDLRDCLTDGTEFRQQAFADFNGYNIKPLKRSALIQF